jgi:hypothetical protein
VRKNANQRPPRINTARQVLIASSASTDGPGSACRASVGVSIIMPCFLIGMELSFKFSAVDRRGQRPGLFQHHPERHRRGCLRRHVVTPRVVASKPSTVSLAALPESCGLAGICLPASAVLGSRLLCGIEASLEQTNPSAPVPFRSLNVI